MRTPYLLALVAILFPGTGQSADRVNVPAGAFSMGCSPDDPRCESDEGPPGGIRVNVPAFQIDRKEVTVAEYRTCVTAGACSRPYGMQTTHYCNYDNPARDDHPVNCLDWGQAQDYCHWVGARLPREAEWEKAARGGTSGPYPWGQEADCTHAILDEISPTPSATEPDGCGRDATWPVASRPANALGIFDMHGNAGEWIANWYGPGAIENHYAKGNLDGPPRGQRRVVRGGSWDENRPNLRSSFRNTKWPEQGEGIYGSIGFRCAADGT
ncbi:MAG: formylglycine-generating enzyme family protein [Chromatiales bacterium]|nr:formylglycine-generating enzyme family protein [Chromatiales bacterium]